MKGFINFIREQGVVGFAVGIILGGSVGKLVSSLVNDIINPSLGLFLGKVGELNKLYVLIGSSKIMYGSFVSSMIDFIIIALVVYFSVTILKLDRLDKKKEVK